MFKNETHNHPTEIEPFGGAATCIGGCIRDPLSGRAYVHQAMRVTGAGDPRASLDQTLSGKLPQRKLCQTAAAGYSSYGNQIGLATGHVAELYHEGYIAKRLECGAVVAAAPAYNVRRECPAPGDVVILLGGRTGRDGIGGATGSSKSHNLKSLSTMASEVQKGNAPEERKIQRLFRDSAVTRLIKRCNDFGAGGVSVAIGELADGLRIDLDAVRKTYDGLDGTELAISESQERMAVVVAPEDVDTFIAAAEAENLEAYRVAVVTEEARMIMEWNGTVIADLSRDFLNTNGAVKHAGVRVAEKDRTELAKPRFQSLREMASSLKCASRRGLVERFDSTIGAGSILMPFGGRTQRTPAQAMAAVFPVLPGQETDQASVMAWGCDPEVRDATMDLLKNRDGLMLGICNGFQALIKLGLVPYGEIIDTDETCPTLTFNTISRHQSRLVRTRVASNRSPWLAGTQVGDIYTVPISHGEGRFLCSEELVRKLADNGQIVTQYVDEHGVPGMDVDVNPNGSIWAVEGIMSPDGRVLGKMGHSERVADGLYKNVDGCYDMKLFQSAKKYFDI